MKLRTYSSDLNQSISAAFCKTKKLKTCLFRKVDFMWSNLAKTLLPFDWTAP